jgi:hypothetical protein
MKNIEFFLIFLLFNIYSFELLLNNNNNTQTYIETCPDDWLLNSNYCLLPVLTETSTWVMANEICKFKNGQLMSIRSDEQFDMIKNHKNYSSDDFWIGARTYNVHKNWTWLNGERLPWKSEWWADKQPDNSGESFTILNEACCCTYPVLFNDKNCTRLMNWICQRNASVVNSRLTCDSTWIRDGIYCYRIYDGNNITETWHGARNNCSAQNSFLMIVHNEEQINFLRRINRNFWIGAQTINVAKNWTWLNGDKLDWNSHWWNDGEPNNFGGKNEDLIEECAFINKTGIHDGKCVALKRFICEKGDFIFVIFFKVFLVD